jgi:flagellar basal-body rod protein FlgC
VAAGIPCVSSSKGLGQTPPATVIAVCWAPADSASLTEGEFKVAGRPTGCKPLLWSALLFVAIRQRHGFLMSNVSAIALSGMNAATRRLEVSANNVANVRSNGRLTSTSGTSSTSGPTAYTPMQVEQVALAGGGTKTSLSAVSPATVAVVDPSAPYADQSGLVAAPNVDLAGEMINQMLASYDFAANLRVLKADDQMKKALLDKTA